MTQGFSNQLFTPTQSVLTGSGAPTMVPSFIGQEYVDTSNGNMYKAVGTSGSYNWAFIGQGGLSTFNKNSVPGLRFWVKSDAGITKDAGNLVSNWNDQSDSGWHLAQATAGSKPLYVDNVINGLPVIRFDGSSDYMNNVSLAINQPSTTFMVGNYIVVDATEDISMSCGTNSIVMNTAGGKFDTYAGTHIGTYVADTNKHIWIAVHNGASSKIITDQTTTTGNAGTANMAQIMIGWYTAGGAYYANINIGEILIYNSALSSTNMATVSAYLNNKWAIY